MDENQVVRLLEEIRDLQRQQVEAYGRALENQREAMRVQRVAVARPRALLAAILAILAIVFIIVVVLLRYVLRHYS